MAMLWVAFAGGLRAVELEGIEMSASKQDAHSYPIDVADSCADGRATPSRPAIAGVFSVQRALIDSIDCLRQPIADADLEIVQLGRGEISGSLTKTVFSKLAFSRAAFSLPLRTTGVPGTTNVTIAMVLGSAGKSTSWGRAR
jgi:hypothetical protein